jgi:hypothetical protein
MTRQQFTIATNISKRYMTVVLAATIVFLALGCKKNPAGTPGTTGATALLTKVTLVGTNAVNNTVESAATLISYDANDNFTQTQFTDTSFGLDITFTTNEITTFTY